MNYLEIINFSYKEAVKGLKPEWFQKPENLDWYKYISNLPETLQITYTVVVLEKEVINGGFDQYFTNLYGQFAFLTIKNLKIINAFKKSNLLENAISTVNQNKEDELGFIKSLLNKKLLKLFSDEQVLNYLNTLDTSYYSSSENIEHLLGSYLVSYQK